MQLNSSIYRRIILSILSFFIPFTFGGCDVKKVNLPASKDTNDLFLSACYNCNQELIDELYGSENISQKTLNKGLFSALSCSFGNSCDVAEYLIEKGADANYSEDALIDYGYNARYMQMQALLTYKDIDLTKEDSAGHNVMCQALENRFCSDWMAYDMCTALLESGAEIDPRIFEEDEFINLSISPRTVSMLINKYLEEGKTLNIPDSYRYALCGNISESAKSAESEKDKLSENQKTIMLIYAACFGTVDDYEKIKDIFSLKETNITLEVVAGCGNIEMLDYLLEVRGQHIKFDPETDSKTGEMTSFDFTLDYKDMSDAFEYALATDQYEMSEYFIKNGIRPFHGDSDYTALTRAINSGDMKLFMLVYDYLKNDIGDLTEELVSSAVLLYSKWCGMTGEITDFEKEVFDKFIDDGYTFNTLYYRFMNDSRSLYLITHGAALNDDVITSLYWNGSVESFKAALDRGYKITSQNIAKEDFFKGFDSSVVQTLIDNDVTFPDDILKYTLSASRATVRMLIDNGANIDIKFTELRKENSGIVHQGDYSLEDYYKFYDRSDLAKIVKEYR